MRTTVSRMIQPLRHRGPDDDGIWCESQQGIALGFKRLAIIDLTPTGHQPMMSPGGRFVGVFNGEIYNHPQLRRELESAGVVFTGSSDTEVLLAAVESWGVQAAFQRFVGMFAVALWDKRQRMLHLVRDRLGIKPLYVFTEPGVVLFGSELKSIMAVKRDSLTVDTQSILAYLRRLHIPAPRSVFKQVKKLEPGTILSFGATNPGTGRSRRYWSAPDVAMKGRSNRFSDPNMAIEELDFRLREAVRSRLLSDVPIGAFLSGGIDSSLVVALMQEVSNQTVKTYAVGFDDPEHNEAPHAAAIARHLETDHTEFTLRAAQALELVPTLPQYFDEPFASSSAIPNLLVCAAAKRHVTVALSGVGGDELFGGYNRYTQLNRLIPLLKLPRQVRNATSMVLRTVPRGSWSWGRRGYTADSPLRLLGEKIRKISNVLQADSPPDVYRALVSIWQDPSRFVPGSVMPTLEDDKILRDSEEMASIVDRAMLADQVGYLADDQLVVGDRASMAASLELRVPILDHRVFETSWKLPPDLRIQRGVGKVALRLILGKRIPKELFDRPKVGFSVPLNSWLHGELRSWAGDLLSPETVKRHGLLDATSAADAWNAFSKGRGEGALAIWTLVMLQAWAAHWEVTS